MGSLLREVERRVVDTKLCTDEPLDNVAREFVLTPCLAFCDLLRLPLIGHIQKPKASSLGEMRARLYMLSSRQNGNKHQCQLDSTIHLLILQTACKY